VYFSRGQGVSITASDDSSVVALLTNWLDGSWEARFLLDDQHRILWSNQSANAWLDRPRCPLKQSENRLQAKDSKVQFKLASLISDAADNEVKSTIIPNPDQAAEMLVCARQVGNVDGRAYFGLCIRSMASGYTHDIIGIVEAYNLTRSEVSVLKKMVRGYTVEKIASVSKTSPETVRTHVRRAYSKMNVSSREEMFSRIRPFLFAR
jgi:DNA-binding CsgD family transcriptional regulator